MNILKDRIYVKDSDDVVYPETSYDQIVAEDSADSGVLYISPGNKTSVATLIGRTPFYYTTVVLYGSDNPRNFKAYFQLFLTKLQYDYLLRLQGKSLALEIYNILNTQNFVSQNHYVSVPATGNVWWSTGGDFAIFSISADGKDNFIFECAGMSDQITFSKNLTSADRRLYSYNLITDILIQQ